MGIENIGEVVCSLRKQKGITQEELGKNIGVSTQAVSKWECGGVPDTELISKIADYFEVSIDSLFGRNINNYSDADIAVGKKIASYKPEEIFGEILNFGWIFQNACFGKTDGVTPISEVRQANPDNEVYSQNLNDNGFTLMHINNNAPYYFVMPETGNNSQYLLGNTDYISLFKIFGDEEYFKSVIYLYQRENKSFTPKLLNKALNINEEKAIEILIKLKEYHMICTSEIELDDETQTIYSFTPNPAFIALLIFAKEIINKPNCFWMYQGGRNAPYLKK
ncbi:MAG: helix-turn-helix domain-containing protein [Eubacteriales bacterium]